MNKILEYQKLDMELLKLKKSNLNSEDKNNMNKLKSYIIDAHDKSNQLDSSAKELVNDYNKLKAQYDKNFEKVQSLTKTELSSISSEEVDNYLSTINSLSSELFLLERDINMIISKMKSSLKEFEVTKNNTIKARQKYNEFKAKYEDGMEKITPKIKAIEDNMKALEKDLNPELFAKYKAIKNDKIFPVFVSLSGGHCAGCRVEIPTSKVNKLKSDGTIICEQCHRIIYHS
ncbi:MAG: hypothetical protein E7345_04150 [Clostridiales bacterium]|nr:hypothetical protein [Clostridiales bacterium]